MRASSPTSTLQVFQHDRVAEGYASARPYLHPAVYGTAHAVMGAGPRVARALDVGCGTGLSSLALLGLADHVTGVDASVEMLRHARRTHAVSYVAASAEHLPFGPGAFDLVLACGSMDWIDRRQFMPQASSLVVRGGWLVSLDFGDAGRSPDIPGLEAWHREVFQRACPTPPASDPMIVAAEADAHGFAAPLETTFEHHVSFDASSYAAFLMTESSVVAVVEYGTRQAAAVRAWLEAELAPLFGAGTCRVVFGGYVQALRRR